MFSVRKLLACLTVATTACVVANQHDVQIGIDAIRAVDASADVLAGVGASNGAIAEVANPELEEGCGAF